MCFESKGDAAERTKEQKQQGKQKSPVGKFANMEWDKQGMKDEVNSYGDDTLVNWSELARRFQIKNKTGELAQNGGQIAIEWLKSEGVNVERFKKRRRECNEGNIRKKLRRAAGGEIAVPCPETNEKVLTKLQEKVLSGEINVGELIVPRKVIKSQLYKIIRF
jgi:hypothetical protein